ncbi:CPBP family intramembrane glutamic endopeptidase [Streptomyces abikoensis]|uniref:CPBP family intramembrane glutamic endopeptidase n=1 Tax=Streptomyces abikoensis TaxID=97398 RepID=UPI003676B285
MRMTRIKAAGLFLAVTFPAAGALGAAQPATRIPAEVVQLTQFGPAVGVGVVALLWPGLVRALFAGRGHGRPARLDPALAVTAVLITTASAAAYGVLSGDVRFTRPSALEHPFALIVVAQLIGACGEEIGWRCFLQPLLRTRFGPLASSVAVGAVWGAWHVQVFAQDPVYAGAFLLGAVSMSVVLGWALEEVAGTGTRLLLAGGFHALVNLGMLLFMDEESGAVPPMVLFGASCLVAAVVWTVARARRAPARIQPTSPTLEHVR